MRRLTLLFAAVLLAGASFVLADDPPPGQLTQKDIPEAPKKPLDLEAGPEAIVLKGKGLIIAPAETASVAGWKHFLSFSVDATYDYDEAEKRIGELSLRPALLRSWTREDPETFGCEHPQQPSTIIAGSFSPYLELRNRAVGTKPADDSKGAFVYGGAGVQYRFNVPKILIWSRITGADIEAPTLSATYYKKISGDLPKDAPEGFDAIQAAFTVDIPLPVTTTRGAGAKFIEERNKYFHEVMCGVADAPLPKSPTRPKYPFTLSVALKASRPTEGASRKSEHSVDVGLKMMKEDSKVGYALRYRTGKDLGFEYDRSLLAGIVLRLFE